MHRVLMLLVSAVFTVISVSAQTTPVIVSAHDKDVTVDGLSDPAAGPIVVLDLSYEVETRIGTAEVSTAGKFAAAVSPALIQGNRLVVVDRLGNRSAPFVVLPARSGPVPSAPN
jgi:hypothetical protein